MNINEVLLKNQIAIMEFLMVIDNDKGEQERTKAKKDLMEKIVSSKFILRAIQ